MNEEDKRLEKAELELEKVVEKTKEAEEIEAKEIKWIEAQAKKEEDYYKWLAQFKAECLEDGIIIENVTNWYISGFTRKGNKFFLENNNGFTERSRHAYCLKINGNTFFTSGLFSTAYIYLKNN